MLRRLFYKKADGKKVLCLTKIRTSRVVVLRLGADIFRFYISLGAFF